LFAAYRNRHPIWAASISFFLSPELGMFYLGRGRLGIIYVAISLLISYALPFTLGHQEIDYPLWASILVFCVYRAAAGAHVYITAKRQPPRARYPWYARFYNWILYLWLLPIVVALLVRNLLVQPFSIPANSMRPTLQQGDYLAAEKLTYGLGRYSIMFALGPERRWGGRLPYRGEVIIFAFPPEPEISYVSRVIGLPGDRVQLREGRLYLNGEMVDRQPRLDPAVQLEDGETLYAERLPDGLEHMIIETGDDARGDNTAEWLVPAGHYFVMGDNRDNSLDSRFGVGFVPAENIEAKPFFIVYSDVKPERWWMPVR
jgi:signal peptidase I